MPADMVKGLDMERLVAFQLTQVKDPDEWRAQLARRENNHELEETSVIILKDGRILQREVTPLRVLDTCVGSTIRIRDVTKVLRYDAVLDNAPPMYWIDRESECITYANPAFCKSLGYSADELVGCRASDFDLQFEGDGMAALERQIQERNGPVGVNSQQRNKDGSLRPVRLWVFKTRVGDKEIYVATARDMTG
jgi:PAS domain S-box-containing protein